MFQRTVLPNGIRVVSEYIPYVRSVSLGAWFETGSRDEDDNQRGFSHFLEHMVFKGTERYSARDIAEIMDMSGGHLNAFTGKEHTCYYARILDEHFPMAANILQEMLLSSLFLESEIDKERGVILEEIKMYEDTPDEQVHDLLCEALWPNHPLGYGILGTRQSVSSVGRRDLLAFMKKHYGTGRLVIASAGNVEHARVIDEFTSVFEALPAGTPKREELPLTRQGERVVKQKDTEQVHLCLGGPALSRRDKRKYELYLLDTITGGGMSSRLFQELREERGLVYSTYSYHSSYRDVGNFAVYAGFSPEHIGEVMDVISRELQKLVREPIPEATLVRAKSQLKGSLMLALESTNNRMTRLAKGEMNYGRIVTPDEMMEAIDTVTLPALHELAEQIYQAEAWSVAAIGPLAEEARRDLLCQKTCS